MKMSKHAECRIRQRGIPQNNLEVVMRFADVEQLVGQRLTVLRLSRQALVGAIQEGIDKTLFTKLRKLAVIQAADGTVVTCVHLHGKKSKAYLRRDRHKFWRT